MRTIGEEEKRKKQGKARKELEVIKRSEDEAREYAESIINTVREPLIALDQDLRVVSVSRSFYEVFKVKPEETVGQLIYDLGNKQWNIPKLRELLETILPQKTTFDNYEVEHDFATIGKRIMLLNARQIQRVLGKERVILLAIEDITERREIEAGLEKTRKELVVIKKAADEASEFAESVINTVREPLISLDQDLRVVSVSRSFYDFFKVEPEETVGQLIYDLGNKQWNIPKLRELLETILPQKTTFDNYEVEHDFATIGHRIMLLNARQIERGMGKERIILLAIEDITERKEIEAGLEKTRKELEERGQELAEANVRLEELSRHKSQFLANMSHELRTPLNSIIGYTKLMLDGLEGEINEEQHKDLQTVYNNSRSLLALINDLLDLAKIEAGKVTVSNEVFTVAELLDKALPAIRWLAGEKGLALDYKVAPGIDHIYADKAKTKQTLINILANAIKFTNQGSIKLDIAENDSEFIFSVSDTGMGIKKKDLEVIFDSFKQVGPAQIAGFEGTGLGLAISKQFVKMQGGRIWAESELGKGSTFTFTLPKKEAPGP